MQHFSYSSEAEDFNPLDHIHNIKTAEEKKSNYPDSSNTVHQDERCRCTCPGKIFDISSIFAVKSREIATFIEI